MSQQSFPEQTWEEIASECGRTMTDTERFLAVLVYRLDHEDDTEGTDMPTALGFFQRARWNRPSNLAATANHAAGRGWVTQVGHSERRKLWRCTRKGFEYFKSRMKAIEPV